MSILMGNWVNNTAYYPPAHIYAGMVQGKAEKNAIRICEELYRFNFGDSPNVLGELRTAFRELDVMIHMKNAYPSHMELRNEHVAEVFGTFLYWALRANQDMERIYKPHQDLWKWYNASKLTNREIKDWCKQQLDYNLNCMMIDVYDNLVRSKG